MVKYPPNKPVALQVQTEWRRQVRQRTKVDHLHEKWEIPLRRAMGTGMKEHGVISWELHVVREIVIASWSEVTQ